MKLNIYTLHWDNGGYGDGLIIIAANTAIEAQELADKDGWKNVEGDLPSQIGSAFFEGTPQVLEATYYQE